MKDNDTSTNYPVSAMQAIHARNVVKPMLIAPALMVLSASALAADLQVGTAAAVTPAAADGFYPTSTTSTTDLWAGGRPVELRELARALRNDADLIYEYVRNTIEYVPIYGLQKGALGTMIDRSGTAFDQAHLMVELLREAGYSARYKAGTITLNATQVNALLGTNNVTAVRAILNDGGIPSSVSGTTTVTSATLGHCWVEVTIGGSNFVFDPAYKTHTQRAAINIATAMGWAETTFLNTAWSTIGTGDQQATPVPWVRDINNTGIESTLNGYASNLLSFLRTNHAASEIEDVIGGQDIDIAVIPTGGLRQTTLPYTSAVQRTWTGGIPDQYRTKLRIEMIYPDGMVSVINRNLFADEVYGRRIVFEIASQIPTFDIKLQVDGITVGSHADANINALMREHYLKFTLDHPYAAAAPGETGTTGHYMDTVFQTRVDLALPVAVVLGFDGASQALLSKLAAERVKDQSITVTPNQGTAGEPEPAGKGSNGNHTRTKLGMNWLVQFGRATFLHARLADAVPQLHHVIGAAYADANVGLFDDCIPVCSTGTWWIRDTSVLLDMQASLSLNSKTAVAAARKGALHAIAASASALEGSLLEQSLDAAETSSTAERFEWANRNLTSTTRYYLVDSTTNASAAYYHNGQLQNPSELRSVVAGYLGGATRAIVVNDSFLGPGNRLGARSSDLVWQPTFQRGSAFVTFRDDATGFNVNHVLTAYFNRNAHGGGAGLSPTYEGIINPAEGANLLADKFDDRTRLKGVDLRDGDFSFSPAADLSVGEGSLPYALELQRTFRHGSNRSPGLPEGWAHNLDLRAQISGSGMDAMGEDSALNGAGSIVALYVTQQLYRTQPSASLDLLKRWVLGPFVQHWWLKHLNQNVVTLNQGHKARQFVRLADGTFNPPRGDGGTLVQSGSRQPVYRNQFEVPSGYPDEFKEWNYAPVSFTYTSPTKDVQAYGYFKVPPVAPVPLVVPRDPGGPGWHILTWSFPQGVNLTFGYETAVGHQDLLRTVTNNLGRTLTLTNEMTDVRCNRIASISAGSRTTQYGGTSCSSNGQLDSVTLPGNETHRYQYVVPASMPAGTRPAPDKHISRILTPGDTSNAKLEVAYDRIWQVQTLKDGVAVKTPAQRNPYTFYIAARHRGERADPVGGEYTVYYDRRGRARQLLDEENRIISQTHDNHDRVVLRTFPEGNRVQFAYDNTTQQIRQVTRLPKAAAYWSGTAANILVSATFDTACRKVKTQTDARNQVTTWVYDPVKCTVTSVTAPAVANPQAGGALQNPVTQYLYTTFGQVRQVTDPTGRIVTYDYDPTTNYLLRRHVNPASLNLTTIYGHNAAGDINAMTDPRGNLTSYTYDGQRRLTRIDAPLSASTVHRYDLDGNLFKVERSLNAAQTAWQIWETTFSASQQPLTRISPTGGITSYQYDGLDRVTVVTDPQGRKVQTQYFGDGQIRRVVRAYQSTTMPAVNYATYTLTPNGKIDTVTDADGSITNLDYDAFDRLARTFFADPATGAPCAPALPHSATAPSGCGANQRYEQLGYDANDNVTSKRNRDGRSLGFAFDNLNREITRTVAANPLGRFARTLSTTYDLGSRKWDVTADGQTLSNRYDAAGRLDFVDDSLLGATNRIDYGYDAADNRTSMTWPGGGSVSYTYDALNRVDLVTDSSGLQLADYDWDTLSRRDLTRFNAGSLSTDLGYENDDDMNLLAHTGPAPVTFGIGRNNVSQITNLTSSDGAFLARPSGNTSSAYAVNRLNQYSTVAGAAQGYDANGNLTGDGTWTFEYDEENRLRSAVGAGMTVSYEYDPAGRRRSKTVNSVVTRYVSDGAEEIEERNAANAVLRKYAYGPGVDDRIAMRDAAACLPAAQPWCFYHVNWQGSAILLVNQNGTVNQTYHYGPFGEGTNWSPSDALTGNPFRYTGRRIDPETGLYYYRARHYSPKLGRFLQVDPIGTRDDINLYAYSRNDPVNRFDAGGTWSAEVHLKVMQAAFGEKRGSSMAPHSVFQDVAMGKYNHMHYLRDPGQFVDVAVAKFKSYVEYNLDMARSLADSEDERLQRIGEDYFTNAVHAVMDSYSPVHNSNGRPRGYNPKWGIRDAMRHGHSPRDSKGGEGSDDLTPELKRQMVEKLQAMDEYVHGGGPMPDVLPPGAPDIDDPCKVIPLTCYRR